MSKLAIRTSDRGIFKSCRRKWDFQSKLRMGLSPVERILAFDFGTSIHAAMEDYYNPILFNETDEVREASAIAAFMRSEDKFWRKLESPSEETILEYKERKELGLGMIKGYFGFAKKNDNFKPVGVEIEFEVPIPCTQMQLENLGVDPYLFTCVDGQLWFENNPVVYQGRVDLLAQDVYDNYWIVDHKTTAQFGSTDHYDLDEQCSSYAWALGRMLNLPIQGVIFNQLRKAAPKPPTILANGTLSKNRQQSTTYDLYLDEIQRRGLDPEDYKDFLEYLSARGDKFFRRVQVNRSETELELLEQRILIEAIEMLHFPRIYPNPGLFNCMGCGYRLPCLALNDGSDLKWILQENYQRS